MISYLKRKFGDEVNSVYEETWKIWIFSLTLFCNIWRRKGLKSVFRKSCQTVSWKQVDYWPWEIFLNILQYSMAQNLKEALFYLLCHRRPPRRKQNFGSEEGYSKERVKNLSSRRVDKSRLIWKLNAWTIQKSKNRITILKHKINKKLKKMGYSGPPHFQTPSVQHLKPLSSTSKTLSSSQKNWQKIAPYNRAFHFFVRKRMLYENFN